MLPKSAELGVRLERNGRPELQMIDQAVKRDLEQTQVSWRQRLQNLQSELKLMAVLAPRVIVVRHLAATPPRPVPRLPRPARQPPAWPSPA